MNTPFSYIQARLRHSRKRAHLHIRVSDDLLEMLAGLAAQERISTAALASRLLAETTSERYHARDENNRHWQTLSKREKQVAALACLGYTNPEIGLQLYISKETVKTHMKNILRKFSLKGRVQLRWALRDWDFAAYQEDSPNNIPPRATPATLP